MIQTTADTVGPSSMWSIGVQHLGMAIITESLRWAAFGCMGATTMPRHVQRIEGARQFDQGSGLELTLDLFGIEMTGDEVRGLFQAWMRRRKTPYSP